MKKAPDYLPMLCEVLNGFEPMIRELQSHALPLGYSTLGIRLSPPNLARWEEPLYPNAAIMTP